MSDMPRPVPGRALAPDWVSPTEDNGSSAPRAELHVALLTPDRESAEKLRGQLRIIRPPLWHGGKIHLHILPRRPGHSDDDHKILQAIADLGFADARDLQIGPPDEETIGYPSGSVK